MTVKVQMDDELKVFEGVTKVEGMLAFDMFENKIIIHQGEQKTTFKEYEIIDIIIECEV
jgi:hypothetical protein